MIGNESASSIRTTGSPGVVVAFLGQVQKLGTNSQGLDLAHCTDQASGLEAGRTGTRPDPRFGKEL